MTVIAVAVALLLSTFAPIGGPVTSSAQKNPQTSGLRAPQCGHWVVLRSCDVLGVPIDMEEVVSLMPFDEQGHSMSTLMKTLQTIGLKVEGKKAAFGQLVEGSFPVIAHLKPDHYVTVVQADDRYVALFDGGGRRKKRLTEEFKQQWTGKILRVSRPSGDVPLPAFLPRGAAESPCVQFDTLLIDKGELEDTGRPVEYVFRFKNVGHGDLIVKQVKTTCTCVKSEKPEKPIAIMEQGVITLKYTLEKTLGSFSQEAYIQTNDPAFPVIRLTVSGNTNRAVSVSPKYLSLGKVVAGIPCRMLCAIEHSGDDPLKIQAIENEGDGVYVKYRVIDDYIGRQKLLAARDDTSRLELLFTYDDATLGRRDTHINLVTNIKGYERITVPVAAFVVRQIEVRPGALVFSSTNSTSKSVTSISRNGKPFRVVRTNAGRLGLTCSFPPDPASEVTITFLSAAPSNGQACSDGSIDIEFEFPDTKALVTTELPVRFWN